MEPSVNIAHDFEQESHRIDQLIWDAMALRAGESVLFCGFSNNLDWIKRGVDIGALVTVISSNSAGMREFDGSPITMLRGSTSMLPARDASFDATIAFHYLHEIDPFFQANVVSELARVGKRCVIVEPAPPSDPLGLRIASLYSRAKREFGQFEYYHHIEHWRKLLAIVKPDVRCQTFSFMRTPPPQAIQDTVALLIDTMAVEETPEHYMEELRALAARPDAKLLPQARYVIVGTSAGRTAGTPSRTDFREATEAAPTATKPCIPPSIDRPATAVQPVAATVYSSAETPEFPGVIPPAANSPIPRNAFGLSAFSEQTAHGGSERPQLDASGDVDEPFRAPETSASAPPADFGWAWEPPEGNGGL